MESYVHKEILRTKSNIYVGAFSLRLNQILKTLNSIELPLCSILHNSPFCEKACNCENFRRKSLLLTTEQFLFLKFEIIQ